MVDNGAKISVNNNFDSVYNVVFSHNCGVSRPTNTGVSHSTGDYICLIDNDALLPRKFFISRWVNCFSQIPELGAVCAKVTTPQPDYIFDSTEQDMYAGMYGSDDLSKAQCVGVLNSTAAMIRRDVWDKVGGENEDYFAYYNDTDLGTRIVKAGYWVVYDPWNVVYHKSENPIHNETKLYYMIRNHYLYCLEHLPWNLVMMNGLKWLFWASHSAIKNGKIRSVRVILQAFLNIVPPLPLTLKRRSPTRDPYVLQAWDKVFR